MRIRPPSIPLIRCIWGIIAPVPMSGISPITARAHHIHSRPGPPYTPVPHSHPRMRNLLSACNILSENRAQAVRHTSRHCVAAPPTCRLHLIGRQGRRHINGQRRLQRKLGVFNPFVFLPRDRIHLPVSHDHSKHNWAVRAQTCNFVLTTGLCASVCKTTSDITSK